MSKIQLKASDLDGYLSETDKQSIDVMMNKYEEVLKIFPDISGNTGDKNDAQEKLITLYNEM